MNIRSGMDNNKRSCLVSGDRSVKSERTLAPPGRPPACAPPIVFIIIVCLPLGGGGAWCLSLGMYNQRAGHVV